MKHYGMRRNLLTVALATALSVMMTDLAVAHNVTIFAWVEGDTVHTESKFAGGRRAKNAPVEVYDADGNKLLEGKTDENGEFSFKAPVKTDLTIVLLAGMGHKAQWDLSAAELQEADDAPPETQETNDIEEAEPAPSLSETGVQPAQPVDSASIEAAVEKALDRNLDKKMAPLLDKKLQPVIKILVDSQEKHPTANDIFSGIGYIFGLMGIAAYVNYRRKT